MQSAYLDYAMSVIVARALPDANDGLKPVQRRIIYAMYDQGMTPGAKYQKCASVVGEVMKKYHPHGDVSIYDALARMAQNFSLRYPLVDGQGNFGSIDGDPPAAMRYTEARLAPISAKLYEDIDKNTVHFDLNYSGDYEEPRVLPAVLPNLLLNGASGIAVGMATSIPPHNLGEIIDGLTYLIEKAEEIGLAPKKDALEQVLTPAFSSQATVEELVKFIKGPDFPTGGIIYDQSETVKMYSSGKGKIIIRGKTSIEEDKGGKFKIVVTELPYQVNKALLQEKIALLVKDKKIEGISDIRDESDRRGLRVVVELKREARPQQVLNLLFKHTELQTAFNANVVALVHGEPKVLTLKMLLEEFIKHRQIVVLRRTQHLLNKAREREHILLGLKIALDHLDEVIKLIRGSKDADEAKIGLIKTFNFTEIQAQAILDMQLRRLAALERKKIEDELKEVQATIKNLEGLLVSPKRLIETVTNELLQLKEKYADERRTKVIKGKIGEFSEEDLITNEQVIVSLTATGYIKRLNVDTYRRQSRGGKGVTGQALKEEDEVSEIKVCSSLDYALFFTNKGKVYKLKVWEIPESSRTSKGTAIVNLINIEQSERIEEFITVEKTIFENRRGYIFLGTRKGNVKKTELSEFENIRQSGILAIKLEKDDSLAWGKLSSGSDQVLIVTDGGQSIRFKGTDVRPMGRQAAGVIGIKLSPNDYVIGMDIINKDNENLSLLIVTEKGYGKKTGIKEYKVQKRGGSGILTYSVTAKTGKVSATKIIDGSMKNDLLIVSNEGKVIRLPERQVPKLGRATLGVRLINLSGNDTVSALAYLAEDLEDSQNGK
ncbi:DNA gyrase subunit A [candidate division WWE3 bacterium RIFCSPHIGHO2_01_FULL_40_23]|uniref:DNA gyrase subunit A n=1 Tax=candidate division WWE3 bacterium RIFCSPLOWO2_01_FULL_41_18 TaxID=1802625 RepID=A0A1F4VEB0_UNCKA|nr:MAG: DNA gyrase subunit A [candidate division WWE3 bacterium RIFCSPHIGHO2_01_FULL_40_23]OGC55586.1 MAG: DNA gyrase subunit A [candidate division WWE3 bacterium RIFCSPLOWO2_01_FULL_41_18]